MECVDNECKISQPAYLSEVTEHLISLCERRVLQLISIEGFVGTAPELKQGLVHLREVKQEHEAKVKTLETEHARIDKVPRVVKKAVEKAEETMSMMLKDLWKHVQDLDEEIGEPDEEILALTKLIEDVIEGLNRSKTSK